MTITSSGNPSDTTRVVEALSARFLEVFPRLEPDSRRAAVQLYRLLERGDPVARDDLARAAEIDRDRVDEILDGWTGVHYEGDRVIGFWGLTPRPVSKHLIRTDGHANYAWCALDTLFLPEILGKTAEIESADPETGAAIRLTVAPDGVRRVDPAPCVVSMIEPREDVRDDVVAKFCRFVHFFPSPDVGSRWVARNPGTLLLSVADAFELGRRRNRGRFKEALQLGGPPDRR